MKLTDIVSYSNMFTEGMVEPNVLLSVRNIVQRGRANNTFEFMVMARMLQMLKHGTFYKEANPLEVNLSTSKDVMDTLRNLPDNDMVHVAQMVYDLLLVKDADCYSHLIKPEQDFTSWINFAASREANQ